MYSVNEADVFSRREKCYRRARCGRIIAAAIDATATTGIGNTIVIKGLLSFCLESQIRHACSSTGFTKLQKHHYLRT